MGQLINSQQIVEAMGLEASVSFQMSNQVQATNQRIFLRSFASRIGIEFDPEDYNPAHGICHPHRDRCAATGRNRQVVTTAMDPAQYLAPSYAAASQATFELPPELEMPAHLPRPEDMQVVYRRVTEEVFVGGQRQQASAPQRSVQYSVNRPTASAAQTFSRHAGELVRVDGGWVFEQGRGLRGELYRWDDWMPVTVQQARDMGYGVPSDATWVLVTRR